MIALLTILVLVVTHHFLAKIFALLDKTGSMHKREQILKAQQEISMVSAQDEFAKWAKMNRKLESMKKELAQSEDESKSQQQLFYALCNYGLYFLEGSALIYWSSEPMFYIPHQWFGPLTSWLKFPFAPMGSVGAFYWWSALKSVLGRVF